VFDSFSLLEVKFQVLHLNTKVETKDKFSMNRGGVLQDGGTMRSGMKLRVPVSISAQAKPTKLRPTLQETEVNTTGDAVDPLSLIHRGITPRSAPFALKPIRAVRS
jgi:hypothetical protein